MDKGAWQATVHGVTKNQTQLSDEHTHTYLYSLVVRNLPGMQVIQVQSLSWEDSLEEEMATHSSILTRNKLTYRGAWWATLHRAAKSWSQLSTDTCM